MSGKTMKTLNVHCFRLILSISIILITSCSNSSKTLKIDGGSRQSADNYLKDGNKKLELSDYHGAYSDFCMALMNNPECADAYAGRGKALVNYKMYAEALEDFYNAISYDSTYKVVVNKHKDAELIENSSQDPDRILSIEPDLLNQVLIRGAQRYNDQKIDEAIGDFSRVLKLTPDNIEALYCRANCYLVQNKYAESMKDYSSIIKLDEMNVDAYLFRGYSKYYLWQLYGAFCDFKNAGRLGCEDAFGNYSNLCIADNHNQGQEKFDFFSIIKLE